MKEILKNKKFIVGAIITAVVVGGVTIYISKKYKEKQLAEANRKMIEQREKAEKEASEKINQKTIDENKGLTDEQLNKKYLLDKDIKNISVQDKVEASEVAKTFVKDITEYDSNNPKKNEKEALSLVSNDIYKEVEGYFMTASKDKGIKEIVVTDIDTQESCDIHKDRENQAYVYIVVGVGYNVIDNYNQKIKENTSYELRLLKIDGKYKIVSYKTY
ncbi:hypothetical protein [Clostridium sardiniense]|uniref:hypothetical protein n=1 Tax=Clostridium sardiniense TaxID=29369 RepID=UPI001FD5604D|nr:hypothetical protein [Clostridium sardiniense]MDQ0461447.1 mannitol-specific phosphotransferase system IIBC component [Clostridium sardiniense]